MPLTARDIELMTAIFRRELERLKPPADGLMTPDQAAEFLNCCKKTLRALDVPVVYIGRAPRYPVSGLRQWIENQTTK